MTTEPAPPVEPEIEAFGAIARGFLIALRGVAFVVGLGALAAAAWIIAEPQLLYSDVASTPPLPTRIAKQMTMVCFGAPLLLRVGWLTRRNAHWLILLGVALWFGPCLLSGDITWGFLVRMFAASVAITALLLWRTLFSLTPRDR